MQSQFEAVVAADELVHQAAGTSYFLPGGQGGSYKRDDGQAFNVRVLKLTPDQASLQGEVLSGAVLLPAGVVMLEAAAAIPLTGRKVRITVEVID